MLSGDLQQPAFNNLQVDDILNHHLKQKQSYNPQNGANHKEMPLTMNIWNPMEKVDVIVAHNSQPDLQNGWEITLCIQNTKGLQ